MKKIIRFLFSFLILTVATRTAGFSQTIENPHDLTMQLLTKYLNEGFADSAASVADTYMNHPGFITDKEFWFYRGVANKALYNNFEKGVAKSPYREKATLSFQKSLEIPGDSMLTINCKKNLRNLATTYHNDAVLLLKEEKASISQSIYLYDKYIELMSRIDQYFDIKEKEIEFANALCPIYSSMFENEKDIHANEYYELAKNCYQKELAIDPDQKTARYNLVVLETNYKTRNERLLREEAAQKDREIISLNAVKELAEAKFYESQLKAIAKKKELIILINAKEKNELKTKAEQAKKDVETIAQNRIQKIIIYSVVAGFLLMLMFAGFIFRSLRGTQKQKSIITLQNKELEKLSIVASETDNAVIIFDRNFRIEWVNEAFTRLTGYTIEEYIGTRGTQLQSLSNHPEIAGIIEECVRTKKSVHFQVEFDSKNGNKMFIQTTLTPILDGQGNIKKVVAIDSDITDLNNANEEINKKKNELEKSFKSVKLLSEIGQKVTSILSVETIVEKVYENVNQLMDASAFGIAIFNEERNWLEFPGFMEKGEKLPIHYQPLEDKERYSVWCFDNQKEIFISDYIGEYNNFFPGATVPSPLAGELPESLIYIPLVHKNRKIGVITVQSFQKSAYNEYHLNILRNLAVYVAIALNNAEAYKVLNHAYDDMNQAHNDLKQTQMQLVQSEKMAGLGQLTAGIAHEINNPINFVSSNVNSLRRDMLDILSLVNKYGEIGTANGETTEKIEEANNYKKEIDYDYLVEEVNNLLSGMEEGAKRTTEIVKGLRNFSRLDESDLKKANIHECIDSTMMLLHSKYKDKIQMHKEYADIPLIECYPGQLNQVFMNILSNAIDAIAEKGDITIKTYLENQQVHISIRDSGTGMSEKTKAHIFEPFFTTKKVGEGTGLGLSISYGIIKKHRGEMIVNSETSKGTEFIIKLPVLQAMNETI